MLAFRTESVLWCCFTVVVSGNTIAPLPSGGSIGVGLAVALHRLSPLLASLACRRSAWRTARCSRWCRRLAFALIGCRCCSHRSRACCYSACCPSLSLQSTAQYAVTGCRVGLSLPSLSSTVAVAQLTRLLTAALYGAPLAALNAVGYAAVGGCVSLAVAVISCNCCSPCSRACRRYLRGVPLVGSLLSLRSSALRRRRFGFAVVLVGCRRCSPRSRVTGFRGGAHPALGRRPLRSRSGRALGEACHFSPFVIYSPYLAAVKAVGAFGAPSGFVPTARWFRRPVRFFGAVCWMRLLDVCVPGSPELIRSGSGSRASGCRVFSD